MKLILSTIILSIFVSDAIGQSPANNTYESQNQQSTKKNIRIIEKGNIDNIELLSPETQKQEIVLPESETQVSLSVNQQKVLIMTNEKNPSQMLVYKTNGEWWSSVRELDLKFNVEKGNIIGSVLIWKGPIRPNTPVKLNVDVVEMKSATEKQFFSKLSELNSNN